MTKKLIFMGVTKNLLFTVNRKINQIQKIKFDLNSKY
jgi:hypothetical protein